MSADDRTPTTTVLAERVELPDRPVDLVSATGARKLERAQYQMARRVVLTFGIGCMVLMGTWISAWFWFAFIAVAVGGWHWAWAPIRALRRERS